MKNLLMLFLFPFIIFSQETSNLGDVDCDGEITSEDASLILQFVTSTIGELPCEENMIGLTANQLEEIIGLISEQVNNSAQNSILMIGPMYNPEDCDVNCFETGEQVFSPTYSNNNIWYTDALRFCAQLNHNGHSDWFLPTFSQFSEYLSEQTEHVVVENPPSEWIDSFGWETFIFRINQNGLNGGFYYQHNVGFVGPIGTNANFITSGSCVCVR